MGSRIVVGAVVLVTAGVGACSGVFGPEGLCAEQQSIEICIDRAEYRPGASVAVTITNRGGSTMFVDVCSIQLDRRSGRLFDPVYDPTRGCGPDVTAADIIAAMRELAPGGELREAVGIPAGIPQAFFRISFWFLDETGARVAGPVSTVVFDVFPSAG